MGPSGMTGLRTTWVAASAVCLFTSLVGANEGESDQLLKAARAGWERLEQAASHLEVEFRFWQRIPPSVSNGLLKEGRILVDGECVVLEFKSLGKDELKDKHNFQDKVFAKNLRYVFELRRGTHSGAHVLTLFKQADAGDNARFTRFATLYAGVPWTIQGVRIWDMPKDSRFRIGPLTKDDSGLVRMKVYRDETTEKGTKEELRIESEMAVILDPAMGWAIRKFENQFKKTWNSGSGSFLEKTHIEYSNEADMFPPVPKRHVDSLFNQDGTERVTFTLDLPRWKYRGTIDQPEFSLSSFGIPEPIGHESSQSFPTYAWLLVGAVVCSAVGIVCQHRNRKRRLIP